MNLSLVLITLLASQATEPTTPSQLLLRRVADHAVPADLTIPGFTVGRVSRSFEVVPPRAEREAKARASRLPMDRSVLIPAGPAASVYLEAYSGGPRRRAHQIGLQVTVFGQPSQADYAFAINAASSSTYWSEISTDLPLGNPAGQRVERPKPTMLNEPGFQVTVLDGNILVRAYFFSGAEDSMAKSIRLRVPPPDFVVTVEGLVRQVLARAQAARAGLSDAPNAGIARIAGAEAPQRRAAGVSFAGVGRLGTNKGGILTFRQGNRTVVAPLSAYEIRINGRPVKLKQPVMEADGQIWIEASALR